MQSQLQSKKKAQEQANVVIERLGGRKYREGTEVHLPEYTVWRKGGTLYFRMSGQLVMEVRLAEGVSGLFQTRRNVRTLTAFLSGIREEAKIRRCVEKILFTLDNSLGRTGSRTRWNYPDGALLFYRGDRGAVIEINGKAFPVELEKPRGGALFSKKNAEALLCFVQSNDEITEALITITEI